MKPPDGARVKLDFGSTTLRIFLPRTCVHAASGWLIGQFDRDSMIVCIRSVLHNTDYPEISSHLADSGLSVLGYWGNLEDESVDETSQKNDISKGPPCDCLVWIEMEADTVSEVPRCKVKCRRVAATHSNPSEFSDYSGALIVLFDVNSLLRSYYLRDIKKEGSTTHNIPLLMKMLLTTQKQRIDFGDVEHTVFVSYDRDPAHTFNSLPRLFIFSFRGVFYVTELVRNSRLINNKPVKFLLSIPAVAIQIGNRYHNLRDSFHNADSSVRSLVLRNSICRNVVDVLLGILFMCWIASSGCTESIAQYVMQWADNVAEELQKLLHWMMGVPAGLKLNSNLDDMLGRFFLYHIHLWTGYLQTLRPMLGNMLWYSSFTGVFGVTIQLSLVQDLVALMTLHIYCFYVYAARLYSVQVYALSAFWRLFRGKKWNVLRQRVDSAIFDVDQLFVGTLLFTILLFLLPTTALYYTVFMVLRVVIITIQGFFYKVVYTFNHLPIYSTVLRFFKPNSVSDNVAFRVLGRDGASECLFLSMTVRAADWSHIWRTSTVSTTHPQTLSWNDLFNNLVSGYLIYPWIEARNFPADNDSKKHC